MSGERGLPTIKGTEGIEVKALHAEHCLLEVTGPQPGLDVGCLVEVWVYYSDATTSLHDRMYGARNGNVEEIFLIDRS